MRHERKAVAIGYTVGEIPKVLAVAHGILVNRLIEIAKENDITIYKDANLAEVLSVINVGSPIPDELFKAAAEVLAYCYETNNEFKRKIDNKIY